MKSSFNLNCSWSPFEIGCCSFVYQIPPETSKKQCWEPGPNSIWLNHHYFYPFTIQKQIFAVNHWKHNSTMSSSLLPTFSFQASAHKNILQGWGKKTTFPGAFFSSWLLLLGTNYKQLLHSWTKAAQSAKSQPLHSQAIRETRCKGAKVRQTPA